MKFVPSALKPELKKIVPIRSEGAASAFALVVAIIVPVPMAMISIPLALRLLAPAGRRRGVSARRTTKT
jgi:hypothetical protein